MRDHHGGLFAYLCVTGIRSVYQGRERGHDAAWSPCCQRQGPELNHPAENRGAGQSYETTLPVACTRLVGTVEEQPGNAEAILYFSSSEQQTAVAISCWRYMTVRSELTYLKSSMWT